MAEFSHLTEATRPSREGCSAWFRIMLGHKGHFFVAECPNNGLIFMIKCPSLGLVLGKCPSSGPLSKITFVLFQKNHFYQNLWSLN